MSIQEQPVRYDIPEQTPSSSIVINRGNDEYDPFAIEDDEHENEQSKDTKHQKQESIRINNGSATHPVIDNTNATSSSDNPSSTHRNDQESRRSSKSPIEHHSRHSDRRSRSPYHHNHYSSDRKRLRLSSPESSIPITTVNNDESLNTDIISSSKQKKSSRNDNQKKSKHHYKHRSSSISSSSKSPSSPVTSNNNKSSDTKEEKSIKSSDNNSTRHSSKRDEYHSHRYNSSRNYYSPSSKYSSRDYSSSTNIDRRSISSNSSNSSRLPSIIIAPDGNTSVHNTESNDHETSTEDRNRIYNRLKNVNDTNTPAVIPINNSNKTSSSGSSAFINSNGGSQRSRSNLIQIVTTEATPVSTQVPPVRLSSSQLKSEPIKPPSVPSVPAKIESTTDTTHSSKSTTSKTNGGTADDMLMEEMLLEEEQEHSPVKSIDLDSLTIPEISTHKSDIQAESIKLITTTTVSTPPTTTISTITSAPSLTPSPTKKLYTLYKVPHTNHVTPPLSSRHRKQTKKEPPITQSDSTTPTKLSTDDSLRRTSLDDRISTLLGAPPTSTNKPTNSSTEQQLDTRLNPSTQPTTTTTSTPSDKSTESPQDITSLISTMIKKGHDHTSSAKKLNTNEERRSTTSKHYTSEWLASQKPEEAPTEELTALPSLVTLPTLISSQITTNNIKSSNSNSGEATMLGKLSEAMSKLIQKQTDTNVPATTTEVDDAVPMSAKHLERLERRRQREKRQSEIASIAKEALKPAFRKHDITKDEYKEIMKKVVTKATHANEVDRIRIGKMIDAYIEKYRAIRQHNTLKISTTSNGNKS